MFHFKCRNHIQIQFKLYSIDSPKKGGIKMFDKNDFKRNFLIWSEQFPLAQEKEVLEFCYENIPLPKHSEYAWLIEQSLDWFTWKKEKLQLKLQYEIEDLN